jgi:hypothetical protein
MFSYVIFETKTKCEEIEPDEDTLQPFDVASLPAIDHGSNVF